MRRNLSDRYVVQINASYSESHFFYLQLLPRPKDPLLQAKLLKSESNWEKEYEIREISCFRGIANATFMKPFWDIFKPTFDCPFQAEQV